jgi:hypothetical protein
VKPPATSDQISDVIALLKQKVSKWTEEFVRALVSINVLPDGGVTVVVGLA